MPAVYAPGIAHVSLSGKIGANPWVSSMYWRDGTSTAAWTTAHLQALADSAFTRFSPFLPNMGNNVTLLKVDALDIGSSTGLFASHLGTPGLIGGGAQPLEPSSLCVNMQFQILQRYRGGKPRADIPLGLASSMANEYQWSNGFIGPLNTTFQTYVNNIDTDMLTAGLTAPNHCVPRYGYTYTNDPVHHKYIKTRTSYTGAVTVVNYKAAQTVGQQRRRLTP